ncbi:M23 family metallopeptidase [Streptomyces tagetis]|uniref:M23 family metallopeptidase n=1 Tax=Streptomyces tagetis TaxID=2820809 RepID=A0A940XRY0_9ACTN|nr:M23 family metallopeptidase [Streptomyces sp. RG38]MBQ0828608.1 M23 family metallopeptidase [Streptomyces sp. RG38]
MNDRHPSGTMTTPAPASDADPAQYASYGTGEAQYGDLTMYGDYDATGYATGAPTTGTYAADPLFGSMPGADTGGYDTSGSYDATQWTSGGGQSYDPYAAQQQAVYDSGSYDATAWNTGYQQPAQQENADASGQWDTGAWQQPEQSGEPADRTQQWDWNAQTFDTGTFDAGTLDAGTLDTGTFETLQPTTQTFDGQHLDTQSFEARSAFDTGAFDSGAFGTGAFDNGAYDSGAYDATQWNTAGPAEPADAPAPTATSPDPAPPAEDGDHPHDGDLAATGELPVVDVLLEDQEDITPSVPAARPGAPRSRRRQPARRSALLTIAVPSACVMSVAGIAAASVGGLSGEDKDTSAQAADTKAAPVAPSTANNKLNTQLANVAAGATDFADRASRTQERIDLKAEQAAEKKRAAEEAARKERLRPKFALPVAQHGLSAFYGQAGINWMSQHTGIDFPVTYGTTVMAATDGTVRTQYNSAYGNMAIVTAKDGTETWYCHLSSYQVPSGTVVKAGEPIAFSGSSGNSTGPHLHFEVRPGGGSAIDPLTWLRSHGLNPS